MAQAPAARFDLVLTGGSAVIDGEISAVDIGVRDGRIAALRSSGSLSRAAAPEATLNMQGLHLLPGVIDSHVHFREPGKEDREDLESGSRGAVLGGVTCIFDMPNTLPAVASAEVLDNKLRRARGRMWCDYGFYIGADGRNTSMLNGLEQRAGVCGVKIFMSSSTTDLVVSDETSIAEILSACRGIVSFHAEDDARIQERRWIAERAKQVSVHGEWRDPESSLRATECAIRLARAARRRIHILHVSTKQELELIARHKPYVTCEALPQHLTFSAPDCYRLLGAKAQQNPPIREQEHQEALWRAIEDGAVEVVASDHGPHTLADKAAEYPNMSAGMPGTQTLIPIMLDHVNKGKLSLRRFVELLSEGPSRIFSLRNKGRIAIGYDADFTVADLKATRTITNEWIASKVGWTAYDGRETMGWPVATLVRGHVVVFEGQLLGDPIGTAVAFERMAMAET